MHFIMLSFSLVDVLHHTHKKYACYCFNKVLLFTGEKNRSITVEISGYVIFCQPCLWRAYLECDAEMNSLLPPSAVAQIAG